MNTILRNIVTVILFSFMLVSCSEDKEEKSSRSNSPLGSDSRSPENPTEGGDWIVPNLGMEFVYVNEGTFEMGCENGSVDEKPIHSVTISRAFWIGKYEVTQEEWQAIMGNNPSHFKGDSNPVEKVSWNDALEFCRKLTERERKAGRLPKGYGYNLPTEAEWEYSARGGQKSRGFEYSGSDDLDSVGWFLDNSGGKTRPVGQKKGNELGLHDMSGNVWEWSHDWFAKYESVSLKDPKGPSSGAFSPRVMIRGGSWLIPAESCRSTNRCKVQPALKSNHFGFRVRLGAVR